MVEPVDYVRSCHPYCFRSGEWAAVRALVVDPVTGHRLFLVEFPDGVTDFWVVDDPAAGYEFRPPSTPSSVDER